jgi:hypothetical protein
VLQRGLAWLGSRVDEDASDYTANISVCLMIFFSPVWGRHYCGHSQAVKKKYFSHTVFRPSMLHGSFFVPNKIQKTISTSLGKLQVTKNVDFLFSSFVFFRKENKNFSKFASIQILNCHLATGTQLKINLLYS